jgi:stalled ribosome rescue protein Dom34
MAANAGIWIDSEHAVIVFSNDPERKVVKINASSTVEADSKSAAAKPAYTKNDFVAENRLKRKSTAVRTSFHRELTKKLKNVDRLLIVGPGTAKKEFVKHLAAERSAPITIEAKAGDKMTDRQFQALVVAHFNAGKTKKAPARKKSSSKRAPVA